MPAYTTFSTARRFGKNVSLFSPGVFLCACFALGALLMAQQSWMQQHGLSALSIAMLAGICLGNSLFRQHAAQFGKGIQFSRQELLRSGIVLYGLRLSLQDITHIGLQAVLIDALIVCSTFGIAIFLGTKVFRLNRELSMLIGAGSAICGAAAIMATEPVVKGKSEEVSVAIAGVVLFGSCSMLLYPIFPRLLTHLSPTAYGIYAGSTIHEAGQVIVAGKAVSDLAADTAIITKMVRVMMLAPFLLLLPAGLRHFHTPCEKNGQTSVRMPWFAVLFILVVGINSTGWIGEAYRVSLIQADTFALSMAMFALGVNTQISTVLKAGWPPFLLSASLWIWLIAGGALVNYLLIAI